MTEQRKTKSSALHTQCAFLTPNSQHLTQCAPRTNVTWQGLLDEEQSDDTVHSVIYFLLIGITVLRSVQNRI